MLDFYRRLWIEKVSRAEALWGAKSALRRKGVPVGVWGTWVLTGAAD